MSTEKQIRSQRFYLFLPALILPFITIVFWLMGGGSVQAETASKKDGFNHHLPDARVGKDSAKDKLAFYEQAASDSAKRSEQIKSDPYTPIQSHSSQPIVANEPVLSKRIESIRERIKIPETGNDPRVIYKSEKPSFENNERIQKQAEDPELAAINETLDKLRELQRPVKQNEAKPKPVGTTLTVESTTGADDSYFGKKDSSLNRHGFFDGENKAGIAEGIFPATIPTTQLIEPGSVVKLQLSQACVVNGQQVAAGCDLYGTVSFENNRIFIVVPTVKVGNNHLPVSLSVYDLDGMEGLNAPNSITRDVIKSGVDQSLQSVNILSLDPSIKTQAAMAGISAAKSLLSRKAKAVRVTISAGYNVFLKNNKQQ